MADTMECFTLRNAEGVEAQILNKGLILHELNIPVERGKRNCVLGLDHIDQYNSEAYFKKYPYLGAFIGRYANRISNAEFELNGKHFQLYKNNGAHCLHGGHMGFDVKYWTIKQDSESKLRATYLSQNGEEGFPGDLNVTVTFSVEGLGLIIDVEATCNTDTPINLTYHPYFNLDESHGNIKNHKLMLNANRFLEQYENLCPTGSILNVSEHSEKDFTSQQSLSTCVRSGGIDTSYIIDKEDNSLGLAGKLTSSKGDLTLSVYTTAPIVHIYSGQSLPEIVKDNGHILPYSGFCLECQAYTDGISHKHFPSTVLRKGEMYRQKTVYQFEAN